MIDKQLPLPWKLTGASCRRSCMTVFGRTRACRADRCPYSAIILPSHVDCNPQNVDKDVAVFKFVDEAHNVFSFV